MLKKVFTKNYPIWAIPTIARLANTHHQGEAECHWQLIDCIYPTVNRNMRLRFIKSNTRCCAFMPACNERNP
jgi:hypothetical protein